MAEKARHRRVLRIDAVKAATGLCRSEVYEKMRTDPTFPQNFPLSDGGRAVGWWEDEIIAYQERRDAARARKMAERQAQSIDREIA